MAGRKIMGYVAGSTSQGSTGNKIIVLPLDGGTPYAVRCSMGARFNTIESNIRKSEGFTDGERTKCISNVNSKTKNHPHSGDSDYLIEHYSSSTTKVFSATFVSWDADELVINVDDADANYQLFLEVWYE